MKPLPPGITAAAFDRGLKSFEAIVGKNQLFVGDNDRAAYEDVYGPSMSPYHHPSAAVAPGSVEEVQAIVRAANEHRIPIWPISRGKNLGYGAAAPAMNGTVVVDLGRLNRILEIDVKRGYALLEPGVGFFDLYDYLEREKIPLWMSIAANAWGSVVGNALERGFGYTPYGDNASQICGIEAVLPDGGMFRTGMGAQTGNPTWNLFRPGFGPDWTGMLCQSNFGIVTKLGLWLEPEPQAAATVDVSLPNFEDIGWWIDTLAPLRLSRVLPSPPNTGNWLGVAAVASQRSQWTDSDAALTDQQIDAIRAKMGLGWWKTTLTFHGLEGAVEAQLKATLDAINNAGHADMKVTRWKRGDPPETALKARPTTLPLQMTNWYGGRGGHLGFSPIVPSDGKICLERIRKAKRRFEEADLDLYHSFTMGERYTTSIALITYDRDNAEMMDRVDKLFRHLVNDAREEGFGEYRTHLTYMDEVADCYDYNDHALRRLNEKLKDLIDPAGILAPGKQGVWPARYRGMRG